MGKPKKGKSSKGVEIDSDGEVDLDPIAKAVKEIEEDAGAKVAGKKGKKKKKKDVDELFDEIAAMGGENEEATEAANDMDEVEAASKGKKGKKGRRKKDDWDVDDIAQEIEALSMDGKNDKGSKANKTAQQQSVQDDENAEESADRQDAKPTNEKPTDSGGDDDDGGPVIKTAAQKKAEKKEREKKKKELQRAEARSRRQKQQKEVEKDAETVEGDQPVAKGTAEAQQDDDDTRDETDKKKKRKKKKKGKDEEEEDEAGEVKESEVTTVAAEGEDKEDAAEGEDDEDGEKKKKKRKKKKGKEEEEKEKEKDKKKKPSKAVRAMQEALQKMKEEEERLKAEEEAKIRAAELAEEKRLEKIRLEKERKEREKQKKKERIERLKKEGKYLTKSQKEAKARAEAMLEALKQQGVEIPSKDTVSEESKKKVRYGARERKKKKDQTEGQTEASTEPQRQNSQEKLEEAKDEKSDETQDEVMASAASADAEEVQESWEEVTESWDAELSEEEEPSQEEKPSQDSIPKAEIRVQSQEEVEPADEDEDEDEEEEEEEEDSEEVSSSEDESESESETESEDERSAVEKARDKVRLRIQKRREEAAAKCSTDNLRSPVVVVLGHVDTGKTKILDKIRHTHVQDGEAGGITQQIGATMVPPEAIKEQTKMCRQFAKEELQIPGLLIIDTPGHESFSNLRSRGSSLCDIAILVVDIMHGLEPQTIESLNLLRSRKTPFIVALNKIDVLYEWKSSPHTDVVNTIKKQKRHTKDEFDERVKMVVTEFAKQGLNAALFNENPDTKTYVSLVPTSAHTADGMGNLIALLVEFSQTKLAKRLSFSENLQCTTLEVKSLLGLGTTVDVVLVNGRLREGDTIILAGQEGPIVTPVRGLLMPQPLKELRVKNQYEKFKEIVGAQGVKVLAKDLEKALAGMPLLVAQHPDEVELLKEEVAQLLKDELKSIKLEDLGVYVQASTLGSLEALLEFLKTSKIPYSGIAIGPVHRKDVMKASIMLERDKQYAVILAFDVKVEREAQEMADREGIKIFQADIIYHLFDKFMAYREEMRLKLREQHKHIAIFPCKLRIIPQYVFNARNPIVVGVSVEGGICKVGTPICVPSKDKILLGAIASIEVNHKNAEIAHRGQEVCIKIEHTAGSDAPKTYGRHFDSKDLLVSQISRESIDAVKKYFREDLQTADWQTMIELKKLLEVL